MSRSPRSQRYKDLEKGLALLRRHLLPKKFDPTGAYPPRVTARTVAYRVLTHAEIEEYLEDRVWEIAKEAVNTLDKTGKVSRVVACLVAFSGKKLELPPATLAPPPRKKPHDWLSKLELVEKAKSALNAFWQSIETNHGVREGDILSLLLPVGIQASQLDPTWLSTIDAFGSQRGVAAHHSCARYGAKHALDPKTELVTVGTILAGLRDIDDYLNRLSY